MNLRHLVYAAIIAAAPFFPAHAQQPGTVTVTVSGVHSSTGVVAANLCDDPAAQFPGACSTYRAISPAKQGATTLTFTNVKPGSYALQLFHDEDGNMRPNIPPEGFAYGNDQPYPPNFGKASIKVAGDTSAGVRMVYLQSFAPAARNSKGAAAPADVTKTDLRENGLYGEFYLPAHDKPLPALIVLGGSEGGIDTSSSVGIGFSKHDYAVLALAYFAETGLSPTLEEIPLEYFDRAVDWLKKQPEVDPRAIGVIGGSRGSEAALLLAARNPDIRAVMAFAPSGIVWQGLDFSDPQNMGPAWTSDGKALPFVTPDPAAYRPGASMRAMFDNVMADADKRLETAIPVEKINGPILLISGKEDALWPSADLAERVVKRLGDQKFKHAVTHLAYEGAGHLVFMGDPSTAGAQAQANAPANPMLGGTGAANANAWADNWPKTIAFFDKALKGAR